MTRFLCLTAFSAIVFCTSIVAAQAAPDQPKADPSQSQINTLQWDDIPGPYELEGSKATYSLSHGNLILRTPDVHRYIYLTQGYEIPGTEAVVAIPATDSEIHFVHYDSGYVSISDWEDVDADALFAEMVANNTELNVERRKTGIPELHMVRWLQEPTLDEERSLVFWSVELTHDGGRTVNSTALNLGRSGYEEIVWVGSYDRYAESDDLLEAALQGYQYDRGFRYADFSDGDKLAGFGIASLVAVAAGANSKAGKTGLAALLAVVIAFAKKFIIVPIAIAATAVWGFIKMLFRRRREDDAGLD